MKALITIEYCPKCGWLLRAAYIAEEILTTFAAELKGVLLQPSEVGGRFWISVNEEIVFDRFLQDGFLGIKAIKQVIRDRVAPGKYLGHTDHK